MAVKDDVEKAEEKQGVQDACNTLLENLTEELVEVDARRVELQATIRTIQRIRDEEGRRFIHDFVDSLGEAVKK